VERVPKTVVFFSELSGFHGRKQRTFKESVDGSNFGTDNADYKKAFFDGHYFAGPYCENTRNTAAGTCRFPS
jgi:hypothetical protein